MIRNLKVLLGAAMALAALGAFGASAAQAHTPAQFHCHVEPCEATLEPDGTGATAHHVFVVKNHVGETVSFTCNTLTGDTTSGTKTATTLEFKNLAYSTCKAINEPVVVRMNGCKYDFAATGTVTITGCDAGKSIEVEIVPTKCVATVAAQGPLTGITFTNLGTTGQSPASTRITAGAKVPNIAVTLDENGVPGSCLLKVTGTITAEYTTGNTIVTGYKDGSAHGTATNKVDVWWKATVA